MKWIKIFWQLEAKAGIILIAATALALLFKNSSAQTVYDALVNFPLKFKVGPVSTDQSLLFWVNDLLMPFFFLLVGLELKRELSEGALKKIKDASLPAIAALGGVVFPAIIYLSLNYKDLTAINGWAIPTATDIAFAAGILSLLGNRIPNQLKICLLSLAIFDDLLAIVIIALFYAKHFSLSWLMCSCIPLLLLALSNFRNISYKSLYFALGGILWLCILKSGIHPTISGVLLAIFIPLKVLPGEKSPLKTLECALHPWVSYLILPCFAFLNAGISLKDFSFDSLTHPIAMGISLGLFLGKQLGVLSFSYAAIKLKLCTLPLNVSLMQYYSMSIVTGIGFTMSIFIGSLALPQPEYQNILKLGVICGSFFSALIGYLALLYSTHHSPSINEQIATDKIQGEKFK